MRLIDKIEINYFRSLYSAEANNIGDLNVLFGRNDSGKSNFLRALNLFFNNKIENTDLEFREEFDFSINLSDARKNADKKFVWIKITFNVPEKYQGTLGMKAIVKKQWNTRGQIPQEAWLLDNGRQIKHSDLTPGQKSQLTRFLNDLDFTYIPAVKDLEMFADLVERMYAAVAESAQLQQETRDFISAIGEQAEQLTEQLGNLFEEGGASLAPPTEMRKLFRNLDFSLGAEGHSLLKQKGDGIKARHIPELLRFINEVEQRNKLFLWGFEEPENSLDLGAASIEARRFFEFAARDDTQVFITSHSPAFYLADVDDGETHISRFFIKKQKGANPGEISPQNAATIINTLEDAEGAMEKAGLLQLPFVIRQMKEREETLEAERARADALHDEAETLRASIAALDTPTLFVEGEHDVRLFSSVLERAGYQNNIQIQPLGGTPNNPNALLNALMNQGGINANASIFFLFDNDKKGRDACRAVCGEKNVSENPVMFNQNAQAWVLPLSEEYQSFLGRWDFDQNSAFFPAEFLFPAHGAAQIYQGILENIENPPEHAVHGDIWNSVKSFQEKSIRLSNCESGTVDWFFSRGVHDDLKAQFAAGVQGSDLDTNHLDTVIERVVSTLIPD
jgi:energy-coupling factor transporter ATP-binding protein EcfA2